MRRSRYLYKDLLNWGNDEATGMLVISTDSNDTVKFKTDEVETITKKMTKHAKALAKAQQAVQTPEKTPKGETEEEREAAIAEAEAFAASQTLNKEYQVKLKGSGKVTVQLSAMGVQVTSKKGKAPTTYLYQALGAWGTTDKGFEINTSDGKTMAFECDERDAEELTDGMTKLAIDLAKAQKEARKAASTSRAAR